LGRRRVRDAHRLGSDQPRLHRDRDRAAERPGDRARNPRRAAGGVIRDRSIVALVSAEIVSQLGSQLSALAIPWFVLVTTGSATKMGLVFAVELAPVAVLGIPSGAVVQRLGARTSMLIADAARAPL